MTKRTALLAGASGLVGRRALAHLLDDDAWSRVVVVGRRALAVDHPRAQEKLEQRTLELSALSTAELPPVDDVFCALGTTMKKAGSREAFYAVDFTGPLDLARATQKRGASQFLLVTALGADPTSRIYYNRVKGEIERAIEEVPFAGRAFLRPSILVGERDESRPGERAGLAVMHVVTRLFGSRWSYAPIEGDVVARAMIALAKRPLKGTLVVDSAELRRIAGDAGRAAPAASQDARA